MQTPPGRLRSRYQNEVVFRSAQSLLTARPSPRGNTARPISRPRTSALIVAAAALFVSGVFVGLRWRSSFGEAMASDAPSSAGSSETPSVENLANTPPLTPSTPSHVHTGKSSPPAARKDQRSRSADKSGSPVSEEPSARALVQAPANARTSALSTGDTEVSSVVNTTVVVGAELTIRGQMSSSSAPPLDLELSLRRKNAALTGVVRYLLPNGKRVVANAVSGEITEGRWVELRETSLAWSVSGTSANIVRHLRPHRTFTFELPAQNAAKDVFSGSWNSNIKYDASSGELTLWFSAPW